MINLIAKIKNFLPMILIMILAGMVSTGTISCEEDATEETVDPLAEKMKTALAGIADIEKLLDRGTIGNAGKDDIVSELTDLLDSAENDGDSQLAELYELAIMAAERTPSTDPLNIIDVAKYVINGIDTAYKNIVLNTIDRLEENDISALNADLDSASFSYGSNALDNISIRDALFTFANALWQYRGVLGQPDPNRELSTAFIIAGQSIDVNADRDAALAAARAGVNRL